MSPPRLAAAAALMADFVERTGVTGVGPGRRYLWTDAFAVCNLLGLAHLGGDGGHAELALRLVERVHTSLGHHRGDDGRTGWLSGLGPEAGEAHPTRGGLRIGKPRPERAPDEPFDEQLEWERDGQYFHYLTRWMIALDQVSHATGQPLFNTWGHELAVAAHRAFVWHPRIGGPRMHWKVSIDGSRPLVTSTGHADPVDGFVTCLQLDATAAALGPPPPPRLTREAVDFAAMIDPSTMASPDPLGIGGLLLDAYRVVQLIPPGALDNHRDLPAVLFGAALVGLRRYLERPDLRSPADGRLAFRELGLAIGLAAIELLEQAVKRSPELVPDAEARVRLAHLARYAPVGAEIAAFWLRPDHRKVASWLAHADINDVMLATCLVPEGLLVPAPIRR